MVTFAVRRRCEPVTLADWEARFDLGKLELMRVVDGGSVATCPSCGALTTEARVYRDGGYLRVFARCGCGHVFERLGQN